MGVNPTEAVLGTPIRIELDWGPRYALWVFNVGLACCAVEFVAASMSRHDFVAAGAMPFAGQAGRADVLVVSGTLTDRMAPAIKRLYDELPGPTYVISFGACANCGGPYWDSYAVTKGLLRLREKLAARPARRDRAYDVAALTAPLVRPPGTVQ
jgi:NADH-quinone oxidoreductase subunit B